MEIVPPLIIIAAGALAWWQAHKPNAGKAAEIAALIGVIAVLYGILQLGFVILG